jgi:hypothetical protein
MLYINCENDYSYSNVTKEKFYNFCINGFWMVLKDFPFIISNNVKTELLSLLVIFIDFWYGILVKTMFNVYH